MSELSQRIAQMPLDERIRLEERLLAARRNGNSRRIPRRDGDGPGPLSFAQERLWILQQFEPDSTAYNEMQIIRMTGPLSVDALARSLEQIAARHDTLAMAFQEIEGELRQVVEPLPSTCLEVIDLGHLADEEQMAAAWEMVGAFRQKVFDLTRPPLWRVLLIRLSPSDYLFVRVVHHIITDGWSSSIFWRELSRLYTGFVTDSPASLPPLPVSYRDFSVWQREWLTGERLEALRKYWRAQLADLPPLNLPLDRPRPPQMSHRGATEWFVVDDALHAQLSALARAGGATLYMLLLAAFQLLLHRYTGQSDFAVGSPIANRTRPEIEGLHGFFANTLVMRADCSGNPSFRALLERVRQRALEAYSHQEMPFEKLVEELHPSRFFNRNPLFDVLFTLQNMPHTEFALADLHCQRLPSPDSVSKFDLSLFLYERANGLEGRLDYATDIFEQSTIRRMIDHFQTLLAGIVADPDCPISKLPLLTERERRQLLVEWNPAEPDFPEQKSIPQLFGEQASRTPNAVAVVEGDRQISYEELDRLSSHLAYRLQLEGVQIGDRIGLVLERSTNAIVAIVAILKAGAVYLPLDLKSPPARLKEMMLNAETRLLLTSSDQTGIPVPKNCRLLPIADLLSTVDEPPSNWTAAILSPDTPAYVTYTSGSTGSPKGITITQRAIISLVCSVDYIQITPSDCLAHLSNLAFDATTFEVWGALLNGASIAILSTQTMLSAQDLRYASQRYRITTIFLTTALFNHLIDNDPTLFDGLPNLLFGGERVSEHHVEACLRHGAPLRLLHVYGPTETTTFATWHLVSSDDSDGESVPIGRPLRHKEIYLLDPYRQPVPIGVPGELYVGGAGLALGYLNRPDLTAERFLPHPFSDKPGARLYRTGDLARYRADGVIEFLGRIDRQVKIRGFRVEPGEIEALLREHPSVRDAVVGLREDEITGRQLVAWWIGREGKPVKAEELRDFLRQRLPDYMLPAAFVPVDAFPLNPNGKIDLEGLPAPDNGLILTTAHAPETALERQLLTLWQRTLGRKKLGIDDNFFDAGGHSLLAVRLMDRVSKATGQELPVASLFYGPTIRQQAALIAQQGWTPPWRSLVPVQPGGSRPPLFLVPPAASSGMRFAQLARLLGTEQPLYGFDPSGLDGRSPIHTAVEEMAAHFVQELRHLQPIGPYLIGGMCFGGHVAYEMARQLGDDAPVVLLLDAGQPANGPGWTLPPRNLLYYLRRLLEYGREGHQWSALQNHLRGRWRRLWRRLYHWSDRSLHRLGAIYGSQLPAMRNYRAVPTHARLILFQSDEPMVQSLQQGWTQLSDRLEIIHFPHTTPRSLLLEDENLEHIAEKLREVIDRWIEDHWQDRPL